MNVILSSQELSHLSIRYIIDLDACTWYLCCGLGLWAISKHYCKLYEKLKYKN